MNCGALAYEHTPEAIAEGIDAISYLSSEERDAMGHRARALAEEYDFRKLTDRLIEVLEDV